jgi:hypothetical protein
MRQKARSLAELVKRAKPIVNRIAGGDGRHQNAFTLTFLAVDAYSRHYTDEQTFERLQQIVAHGTYLLEQSARDVAQLATIIGADRPLVLSEEHASDLIQRERRGNVIDLVEALAARGRRMQP